MGLSKTLIFADFFPDLAFCLSISSLDCGWEAKRTEVLKPRFYSFWLFCSQFCNSEVSKVDSDWNSPKTPSCSIQKQRNTKFWHLLPKSGPKSLWNTSFSSFIENICIFVSICVCDCMCVCVSMYVCVCVCVCVSVFVSACLSVCVCVSLSLSLFLSLSFCLSLSLSLSVSLSLSLSLSVSLFLSLSVCLFVCPCLFLLSRGQSVSNKSCERSHHGSMQMSLDGM